jgi:hypothetical protein
MLDKAGNVSTFPFLILCVMKTPSHLGLATENQGLTLNRGSF